MSADDQHERGRPGDGEHGHLVEHVVVHDRSGWHRAWRITRFGLLVLLALAVAAFVVLWIWRKPIAENVIANELERRGVQATYTLDRIGLHNQRISNVTIGDPRNPDLVARQALIQMRIKWNGSVEVYRIAARGVRLKGRLLENGRVTWGQIDKLLPPPSGKPFRLPDVVLDIADSAIRLDTPYGRLGFAVAGRGNLTGGFKGRLAVASRHLDVGACSLDRLRSNVAIGVVARRPQVAGPVAANAFNCPASRMAMVSPRLEIDSSFSEAFTDFDGRGRLAVASFTAGDNGLANLIANIGFKGTPTDARGRFDLAAQAARLAVINAERTRLRGAYRLQSDAGRLFVAADYEANSASLARSMLASITDPLDGASGTPLGPIAKAIAGAIRRTAGNFDASGRLVLVNMPGGGGVRVEAADARGPGGARVRVAGRDGINYYWPSGKIRIDSDISMGGGGLPRAEIALSQPRSGAPMSGEARIAPYAAGGARVAFAPINFRASRDGATEVSTTALLSGPFSGGRVDDLRIPISGRIGGPQGGFAFGRGCIETRFRRLQAGALRLGPTRLPLCPTGPAILYQRADGSLGVGAEARNLRLAGNLGQSPFLLNAGTARLTGGDRFALTRMAMQLGKATSPVKVQAASLTGRFAGGGVRGEFDGATATIGRVPLGLSDASGTWTYRNAFLDIDGALTLSHLAEQPNFYPLRSNDVHFRLGGDRVTATGTLIHPDSGTRVTNVTIEHRVSTGDGEAILDVPGIQFGNALQPEELTRLTQGVIALVNGGLSGQGRIAWTGGGTVTSTGEFTVNDMDVAAPFGPVTGMRGTIRFTDLLGLETAPGQVMTVESINPGILVENGAIRYQLLPDQLVKIERGEWPFMGGRLILHETILNFARPTAKRLTFEVAGLDARTFVESLDFKELEASGTFDGVLPMIFDENGGRIVGGRLDSRPGGGFLRYNGVVNKANLGTMGNIAFEALRDLRFNSMILRLDGDLAGEFVTRATIDGVGLGQTGTQKIIRNLLRKIPLKVNLTIRGPFRALIATAKSYRDPRQVIEEVLPRPLDEVPGIVTEVRRKEEDQQQSQTPVEEETVPVQPPTPTE
ncbi:MAG TPA: YdbH domain-containing protein [Sphingomicrobium sp.]|nr:YdbH domain-containing protein [Sphingomicrobium sp.]